MSCRQPLLEAPNVIPIGIGNSEFSIEDHAVMLGENNELYQDERGK